MNSEHLKFLCKINCKGDCKTPEAVQWEEESVAPLCPGPYLNGEFEVDSASVCTFNPNLFRTYWTGYPMSEMTIEPIGHLKNAPHIVKEARTKAKQI